MGRRRHVPQFEVGRALARLLEATGHGKTLAVLERKSGVPQTTIGRILRGEVDPQMRTIKLLARGLRVPVRTLAAIVAGEKADHQTEVDCALLRALACREERKQCEVALVHLRRKEHDAIERLEELVRKAGQGTPP